MKGKKNIPIKSKRVSNRNTGKETIKDQMLFSGEKKVGRQWRWLSLASENMKQTHFVLIHILFSQIHKS